MPPYESVDIAWVAVVKIANLLPGQSEHDRMLALLEQLPVDFVHRLLHRPSVDALLNLNPPLESLLSAQHERLNAERTAGELATVRERRGDDPKAALRSLADVLKRVRNRRAHGFKTTDGPRDGVVLQAAADILQELGEAGLACLDDSQIEETQAGIAELDAGRTVSHEKASKWLKSWGKPGEAKAPR